MDKLIKEFKLQEDVEKPVIGLKKTDYEFESMTGSVRFDYDLCVDCESKICIESCIPQILKLEDGKPSLAISTEDAKKGKCIECLACELECMKHGNKGCYVNLPIEDLESITEKSQ
jgi:NAD-dependent dihydropyrimidine dehydrogenase PreA subunit